MTKFKRVRTRETVWKRNALIAKPDNLGSMRRLTCWKERTDSYNVSLTYTYTLLHGHTHTQINVIFKKDVLKKVSK